MNAIDGRPLCQDNVDVEALGEWYAQGVERYDVSSLGFSILDTHAHSHLTAGEHPYSVGRFMQFVFGNYCRDYNRRYGLRGHVLRAQYFRVVVKDARHSINTLRYVPLNVWMAGIVRSIPDLETSNRTSHAQALMNAPPRWIDLEALHRRYAETTERAVEKIRNWIVSGITETDWYEEVNDLLRRVPQLRATLPSVDREREFARAKRLACEAAGIPDEEFSNPRENRAVLARGIVAWLLSQRFLFRDRELAERLGVPRGSITRLRALGEAACKAQNITLYTPLRISEATPIIATRDVL